MLRPMPRMRGRRYSRCASSTCARARGVVACRSKTFRMTASRSATGRPVASSRLRVCEGVSSASTTSRSAPASRAEIPIRSAIPLRMSVRGSGRCSSCSSVPTMRSPCVLTRLAISASWAVRRACVPATLDRQDVAGVAVRRVGCPGCFAALPVRHDLLPATIVGQWNFGVLFNGSRMNLHRSCPLRAGPARGAPNVGARFQGGRGCAFAGRQRSVAQEPGVGRARATTRIRRSART